MTCHICPAVQNFFNILDFRKKGPVSNFRLNRFLYRGANWQILANYPNGFLVAGFYCVTFFFGTPK